MASYWSSPGVGYGRGQSGAKRHHCNAPWDRKVRYKPRSKQVNGTGRTTQVKDKLRSSTEDPEKSDCMWSSLRLSTVLCCTELVLKGHRSLKVVGHSRSTRRDIDHILQTVLLLSRRT
ncbi:hypothetical protein GDO81_004030 [Engystomops pustulosus]|uniref:Uncharacterized protein n=1 Tax=Engystomops pustulosus TaxID=76066 RepID=A0AAV6ZX89_ENGPU|nr:hypothetical protein GDO81_004030 [Engystomops pustulosus]